MAMLLAMFQKMRLIREKNQLVLEQMQYSSKLSRLEKNIERKQKYYQSLFTQLEQQGNSLKNNATLFYQQMFGVSANNINPYNYSGMNTGIAAGIMAILRNGGCGVNIGEKGSDDKIVPSFLKDADLNELLNHVTNMGSLQQFKNADGTVGYGDPNGYNISEHDYKVLMTAKNMATAQQEQNQMNCQQMSNQYTNNISIWLEGRKAQLEAEQDAALAPLNYEQTMMELNKTQVEARLKRIEQEEQKIDELYSKECENATPSFGLG